MLQRLLMNASNVLLRDSEKFVDNYAQLKNTIDNQIQSVLFDEEWYQLFYDDVGPAVAAGHYADAYDHFVRAGFPSGRLGAPMPIDEGWYRNYYSDINKALTEGTLKCASEHFRRFGFFESRAASAYHLVDREWYLLAYPSSGAEIDLGLFLSAQDHYNRQGYALGFWASKWAATAG
jgi:hypothetical protein